VHFNNIAAWGTAYLDRAAATEYIQYRSGAAVLLLAGDSAAMRRLQRSVMAAAVSPGWPSHQPTTAVTTADHTWELSACLAGRSSQFAP
jgi:hypothetical protein